MAVEAPSRIDILTADKKPYDMGFEQNVVVLYKPGTNVPYASFEYKKVYIITCEKIRTSLLILEFFQKQVQIKNKEALKDHCLALKELKVELHGYGLLNIFIRNLQPND